MPNPKRLELTWIGKETRPRLEPRILLEDPAKSYHAPHRTGQSDIFDNRLIFGDNLLALKALEQEFTGKVTCVYIDPPYNTGSAFEHYDDGLEHSIWLGLIRDRLELLKKLLKNDGSIWISIDNKEHPYLQVLCDEVFGRSNFRSNIVWKKVSSAKSQSNFLGNVVEYILLYSKSEVCSFYPQYLKGDEEKDLKNYPYIEEDTNRRYGSFDFTQKGQGQPRVFWGKEIEPLKGKHWIWTQEKIDAGIKNKLIIRTSSGLPRLKRYLDIKKGNYISDLWNDAEVAPISANSREAMDFFGQKPESLIKRIIELSTNPGDLVLDSFAGSGTTGAVAHKMGRRWIMVELGEHCHTHIIPRLKKVIDGEDPGGVTEATGWKGGGGFRYYRLAPSLLQKDKWGNWIINKEYNAEMLAEAVCKLEGFTYEPSDSVYWMHGKSTESDFIYVTTAHLIAEQLALLSEEVGTSRTLLVMCTAFRSRAGGFPNLTVKKIPNAVLAKCEWGHDDYSLQIENLPMAEKLEKKQGELFEEDD